MTRKTSQQTQPDANNPETPPEFPPFESVGPKAFAADPLAGITPGNGQDPAPSVDPITGEPTKPLPESASPPPPQPNRTQKVARKLDLEGIRKTRAQITATVGQAFRIPVIDSPSSSFFIRAHPTFGGFDDPMPIWKREGVGKGSGGPLLVKTHMIDRIRAHGGKVSMCGLWWCQYSVGGQFLVVANAESDNDWIASARKIYEACRSRWLKRVNAGNCWEGLPPPGPIPDPQWADLEWDDVLNLAFDEAVDEDHPAYLSLVYGGYAPVAKG